MTRQPPRPPRGSRPWTSPTRGTGRGELAPNFFPKPKSRTELGITFNSNGTVSIHRYEEVKGKPDEIQPLKKARVKGQYVAIRAVTHTQESIREEAQAIGGLYRALMVIGYVVSQGWSQREVAEKKYVLEKLRDATAALGDPERIKSTYKKNAQKAIEEAVDFLEDGNMMVGLGKIRKAGNDLIARQNQLRRQHTFIARRGKRIAGDVQKERVYFKNALEGIEDLLRHIPHSTRFETV
ncbi:MAG: hypothetical protein AABY11_00090, partial [archaeon]